MAVAGDSTEPTARWGGWGQVTHSGQDRITTSEDLLAATALLRTNPVAPTLPCLGRGRADGRHA